MPRAVGSSAPNRARAVRGRYRASANRCGETAVAGVPGQLLGRRGLRLAPAATLPLRLHPRRLRPRIEPSRVRLPPARARGPAGRPAHRRLLRKPFARRTASRYPRRTRIIRPRGGRSRFRRRPAHRGLRLGRPLATASFLLPASSGSLLLFVLLFACSVFHREGEP